MADEQRTDNWGRWGADDECGALNHVTSRHVLSALGTVTEGTVVSLAQPHGPGAMSSPHRLRPARFMDRDAGDYASGARAPDGFKFAEDTIQLSSHSGTHLDALSHAWEGERLYNGHPASSVRSTRGAERCGAETLTPIVTRGLLLDVPALVGRDLEPGEAVNADHVSACLNRSGAEIGPGDAVLIRTGWWERGQDRLAYHHDEPGIDVSAARLLADHDVCIVGADNYAVEQQPSAPGTTFPVHLLLLHKFGVPLLENLALGALAVQLTELGRIEFTFVAAPLPFEGSTAGPVHPLAIV